jgi:hypothetical protein
MIIFVCYYLIDSNIVYYGCKLNCVCVFFSHKLMYFSTVDVLIILLHDCGYHVNWHSESYTVFFDDVWCVRAVH